jgi:hypothetical protein
LWHCWFGVLVLRKCLPNVTRHVCGDVPVYVVPGEFYATIQQSFPIHRHLVMLFQGRGQVVHVVHVDYFYHKVINNKAENDTAPDVTPEAWSVLALVVTLFGQSLFEELVGDDAGLGEAVHAFANFDIDPSFYVDPVPEVVFNDDLFGDDV